MKSETKGILFGITAYSLWGVFPIYWKLLQSVPAIPIVAHRIVWSFVFLFSYLTLRKRIQEFLRNYLNKKLLTAYALSATLVSINWVTYVWGVQSGKIVETSLGYFINPLFTVCLAVLVLGERLRILQWIAIVFAGIGVGYLTFAYGQIPWVALILAFTFGLYGLIRKLVPLGSLYGLTLETSFILPFALGYLALRNIRGEDYFLEWGSGPAVLLVGGGLFTIAPLLFFSAAAKRAPLTIVGILQYIAPTIQFLIGVFLYNEPFTSQKWIGFSFVWVALLLLALENLWNFRKRSPF